MNRMWFKSAAVLVLWKCIGTVSCTLAHTVVSSICILCTFDFALSICVSAIGIVYADKCKRNLAICKDCNFN